MGKPCPKHTAEFKRRAAQPCNERGTACAEVAREAGVDPSGLADWVRRAPAAAPDAEADPFQMAGDLRRPRRGSERLKRESEMLLKASALLAGRQLQAPGRGRRGSLPSCSAPGVTRQGCCARRSRGPIGRTMREAGIGPSTGSIASPWDDAAMESPMGPVEAGCARPHARDAGSGGIGDVRLHRVLLQQGADPLRARQPRPRGVRGEACAGSRRGGVEGVNEIGVNSDSDSDPRPARELLRSMPTDADIDFLYRTYSASPKREDGGPEWGDRAVWEELRRKDPYPFWLD